MNHIPILINLAPCAPSLQVPILLLVTLIVSAIPAIAVFVWLPNPPLQAAGKAPPLPLQDAEAALYYDGEAGRAPLASMGLTGTCSALCRSAVTVSSEAWAGLRSPSFCLVALSGGSTMAVWGAWSGVLPTVMTPQFTAVQAGAVGSVATFASIAGA